MPGNHCGSTALRNLLAFDGIEISEEMALGLGAGVCFYYVPLEGQSPSRFTNGRVGRLEEQFCELTGAALRFETFDDANASWAAARSAVDAGRPALLLDGPLLPRPLRTLGPLPGHAVILAGYDDEVAYLSDTGFEELQTTKLEHLAEARHGQHPVFPLDGQMLTVPDPEALRDPQPGGRGGDRAQRAADDRAGDGRLRGAAGACAASRTSCRAGREELEDWQWSARFCYQVIERRGTGGGNFRLMYSRFLEEADRPEARIAAEAATGWTTLAGSLLEASEAEAPDAALWSRIGDEAAAVLEAEERLWPALAA